MADRVGVAVVGDDDEHRPEDLLLGDLHLVVHVGEDGRLDVVALVEPGRPAATDGDLRPLLLATARCSPRRGRAGGSATSGPTSVAGSSGSPTVMALTCSTSASTTSS